MRLTTLETLLGKKQKVVGGTRYRAVYSLFGHYWSWGEVREQTREVLLIDTFTKHVSQVINNKR